MLNLLRQGSGYGEAYGHMTMTFNKAPLLEMVAEIKWGEAPPQPMPGVPMLLSGRNNIETSFFRLGGELYQHGFRRVERVVPPGFPLLPFQPVYRYHPDTETSPSVSYQAGPGIFVVNAVPPYRSWETVEPYVALGVRALLQTRETSDNGPFNVVSLRYINGFGVDLIEGRDVGSFVSEIFGFKLKFPPSLTKFQRVGALIEPHLQLSVPLENGASLAVLIAQGTINNESKLILDLSVTSGTPVMADEGNVMTSFRNARNVIHDIFVNWTKPIHHLLEPVEDDQHAS